jgi:hypothetical protein
MTAHQIFRRSRINGLTVAAAAILTTLIVFTIENQSPQVTVIEYSPDVICLDIHFSNAGCTDYGDIFELAAEVRSAMRIVFTGFDRNPVIFVRIAPSAIRREDYGLVCGSQSR